MRQTLAIALFAALAACTAEPTGSGGGGSVTVAVQVQPAAVVPGDFALVTVTAQLPDAQTLTLFELVVSGLNSDQRIALPIKGSGPQLAFFQIGVPNGPIAGQMSFVARAGAPGGNHSAAATLTVTDDGLPQVTLSAPDSLSPFDSLTVTIDAHDAAFITELELHLEGAVQRDTTIHPSNAAQVDWTFRTQVPKTAPVGDSVVIRARARDGFGNVSTRQRAVAIVDTVAAARTWTRGTGS